MYRFFIRKYTCIPYTCILLHSLIQEVQGNPIFWPLKSFNDWRYLNHLRSYCLCAHLSAQKEMLCHNSHRTSEGLRLQRVSGGHLIQFLLLRQGSLRGLGPFSLPYSCISFDLMGEQWKIQWKIQNSRYFCYLFACCNYTYYRPTQNLLKFC